MSQFTDLNLNFECKFETNKDFLISIFDDDDLIFLSIALKSSQNGKSHI